MIHRKLGLPEKMSFFLFGPRQTGKTTLIESNFTANTWSINLLFSEEFLKYTKAPDLFRREAIEKITNKNITTIFIDEVQKVPEILNEVHYLIEHYSCKFILSGSSARKLKRGHANLLAGRAIQRYLFPYIYEEISDTFLLEDVLHYGTLPAVYLRDEADKRDILKTYTETYLKEEIQQEALVRNLGGFSRFLEIAAAQFGELVNFSAVGRDCHLLTPTVQSYYEILEDTLIGFKLQPWLRSARKRMVAHPRFYFFDNGITNSINHRLNSPLDPQTRGRLFEQFIILETYRLIHYSQSETKMFFWRTNNGAEVDLLLEKNGQIVAAFEIKSTKEVTGADLSGIRSFKEDFTDTPTFVVANVNNAYTLDETKVIPWSEYLQSLHAFL